MKCDSCSDCECLNGWKKFAKDLNIQNSKLMDEKHDLEVMLGLLLYLLGVRNEM